MAGSGHDDFFGGGVLRHFRVFFLASRVRGPYESILFRGGERVVRVSNANFRRAFRSGSRGFSATIVGIYFRLSGHVFNFLVFDFQVVSSFQIFRFFYLDLFFVCFYTL